MAILEFADDYRLPDAQFLIDGPRIRTNGRVDMKIKRKHLLIALLMGGILCVTLGCILSKRLQILKEGFGIYLLENDELVLSEEDIISYNETSHEIKLNEEGVKKIKTLNVPISGIPFVIKINGKKMYNGAFWSPFSSKSYSGIVILIQDNSIKIETGYPSSEFFKGLDPRNNFEIIKYFQKLKN